MTPMQNVMTMNTPMSDSFTSAGATVMNARPTQTMPLSFQKDGDVVEVVKVRVVSEQAGNLIVEVKGARIAIDKTAASKIMTR